MEKSSISRTITISSWSSLNIPSATTSKSTKIVKRQKKKHLGTVIFFNHINKKTCSELHVYERKLESTVGLTMYHGRKYNRSCYMPWLEIQSKVKQLIAADYSSATVSLEIQKKNER